MLDYKDEERISKINAYELFNNDIFDTFEVGKFAGLSKIHEHLFNKVYDFAGELRRVNIAKGNFRFASILYLDISLENIDNMPHTTFDEIVEKYVEMNIAHPFREGNGRSTRIWLDWILKHNLSTVIDWSRVDKNDYLLAMQRSPITDLQLKFILKNALTDDIYNRDIYLKSIDASFYYEGLNAYKIIDLIE